MKKIVVTAILTLMLATVGGMTGAKAEPGPNGNNDHGLCTAYFNGQKNGHDKNGQPGPFQALEDAGRAYTDSDGVDNDQDGEIDEENENQDLSAAENVFNFCHNTSSIGGNPSHGRYTCVADGANSDPECTDNPAPGKSGKKG